MLGAVGFALIILFGQLSMKQMPVVPTAMVEVDPAGLLPPLRSAPDEPKGIASDEALFEITLGYPADGNLARLLVQTGAVDGEAEQAVRLLSDELGANVDTIFAIKLALGERLGSNGRSIERLTILHDLGRTVIARRGTDLTLAQGTPQTKQVAVTVDPANVHGSLRAAGFDARLALQGSALLERARDVRHVTAVIADRPDRFEQRGVAELLYLAAARDGQRPLRMLRWPGAPEGWIDVDKFESQQGLLQPVAGRLTSRFGTRLHPILRFLRPHQGVDYAASWGTPVRAAADGRVIGTGWSGGYGRQVKLEHGAATLTTYSHLSDIVAAPNSLVRRGQLIGYVGASGLATGPHLHFEVVRMGKRVDPLGARLLQGNAADRAAIHARLAQLQIAGA